MYGALKSEENWIVESDTTDVKEKCAVSMFTV